MARRVCGAVESIVGGRVIIVLLTLGVVCVLCSGFVLVLTFGGVLLWRHPELQEAAEARPWDR